MTHRDYTRRRGISSLTADFEQEQGRRKDLNDSVSGTSVLTRGGFEKNGGEGAITVSDVISTSYYCSLDLHEKYILLSAPDHHPVLSLRTMSGTATRNTLSGLGVKGEGGN